MSVLRISAEHAPAIGDVRQVGAGDTVVLSADATSRPDFPRYMDAVGIALARGAEVRRSHGD